MKTNPPTDSIEGLPATASYADAHPEFPKGNPFIESAWRIGWEVGHGLRKAPKLGVREGLEDHYMLGLAVAAKDRHNDQVQPASEPT